MFSAVALTKGPVGHSRRSVARRCPVPHCSTPSSFPWLDSMILNPRSAGRGEQLVRWKNEPDKITEKMLWWIHQVEHRRRTSSNEQATWEGISSKVLQFPPDYSLFYWFDGLELFVCVLWKSERVPTRKKETRRRFRSTFARWIKCAQSWNRRPTRESCTALYRTAGHLKQQCGLLETQSDL